MLNPNFGQFFFIAYKKGNLEFQTGSPVEMLWGYPTALTDVITYRFCDWSFQTCPQTSQLSLCLKWRNKMGHQDE